MNPKMKVEGTRGIRESVGVFILQESGNQGIRESVEPQIKVAGIRNQGIRESVEPKMKVAGIRNQGIS